MNSSKQGALFDDLVPSPPGNPENIHGPKFCGDFCYAYRKRVNGELEEQ